MRILIDNVNGDPWRHLCGEDTSGQNLFVYELATRLSLIGHKVDVTTRATSNSDILINQISDNLRLFRIPSGPHQYIHRDRVEGLLDDYVISLESLLRKRDLIYDVIHGNYWLSAKVVLKLWKDGYADSLVYTPHSLGRLKARSVGIMNETRDNLESEIIRDADAIHAISKDDAERIGKLYIRPKKILKAAHGVNHRIFFYTPRLEARARLGWLQDKIILLFVGRFEPQKNLPAVIRMYSALRKKFRQIDSISLVICGGSTESAPSRTDLPAAIQHELKTLGDGEVKFIGRVPNRHLRLFYAAANALILPSVYLVGRR